MKQTLLLTTLPNGMRTEGGQTFLKLSVAFSIRLEGVNQSTLSDFPDVLHWHDELAQMIFTLDLGNGVQQVVEPNRAILDRSFWEALFHDEILVKGYESEDLTIKRIHTYQVKGIATFLKKTYLQFGLSDPVRPVRATRLAADNELVKIGRFRPLTEAKLNSIKRMKTVTPQLVRKELVVENREMDNQRQLIRSRNFQQLKNKRQHADFNFVQLRDFHKLKYKLKEQTIKPIEKPEFEFHDITAILSSYPQIQRKLGLILDFEIALPEGISPQGTLKIYPSETDWEIPTEISTPRTAYRLTDDGFFAREKKDTLLKNGFVKINTAEFSVNQLDTDGTAMQLANMVDSRIEAETFRKLDFARQSEKTEQADFQQKNPLLGRFELPVEIPDEEDEGMPPMRSSGIGIVKNDVDEFMNHRFEIGKKLQQDFVHRKYVKPGKIIIEPEEVLYAEDITMGYRMDIAYSDAPETWYSLHWKNDQVTFYDSDNTPYAVSDIENDEGYMQVAAAQDPEDEDDLFVSETLFRWEGWSLSVPRPGFAINEADEDDPEHAKDWVNTSRTAELKKISFDPTLNFRLNVQPQTVPGTLPRLRFGKSYNIRVRTVDLAGNSVPLGSESNNKAQTEVTNFTYQRFEPVSNPVLFLANALKRSESPEVLIIRSNFDVSAADYESGEGSGNGSTARHLLPPENSQQMVELHGKIEDAFTRDQQMVQQIYALITQREESPMVVENGNAKIYQSSQAEITYLPDPMAAGVSLFLTDDNEATHSQTFEPQMFGFYTNQPLSPSESDKSASQNWLNLNSMRIQLIEGETATNWESAERLLIISLPKGHRLKLKFSTFWRATDLQELSGVYNMLKEQNPSEWETIDELAKAGKHWMLSPARELELVHAVQQPVTPPVIEALIPSRTFDATDATLNSHFTLHAPSTEELEIEARWDEIEDNVLYTEPKTFPATARLDQLVIGYHENSKWMGLAPDPKPETPKNLRPSGIITYQKTAGKRRQTSSLQAKARPFKLQPLQLELIGKIAVKNPLIHRFGDTKHRWVAYRGVGTSRYAEMFTDEQTARPVHREGDWFKKVNLLATARPAPPEILYVVPLMHWEKSDGDEVMEHHRNGGGLRVYMKRPWFSSGEGEELAIILRAANTKPGMLRLPGNPDYSPWFTQWAIDPIHPSKPSTQNGPQFSDFGFNHGTDRNLEYPNLENARTDVVTYPVSFDKERQLWYADISINPGAMYFPFVRLLIARYQKHALRQSSHDVCLSPVVKADFIQLLPDRRTKVEFRNDQNNSKFTITISGQVPYHYKNKPGLRFEISFLDPELAQPIYGLLDDGRGFEELKRFNFTVRLTREQAQNGYFYLKQNFNLPGKYRSQPFEIVVREYEEAPGAASERAPKKGTTRLPLPNQPKLVYADLFKINTLKENKR